MNAQTAGSTAVDGTSIDMTAYDGVMFVASVGALTATQVTTLQAKGSNDNTTFNPFTTNAQTLAMADADSNKLLVLDIFRPMTRFVRPTINRGTANAVINCVIAILYNADKLPSTDATSVSQHATFVSP
ncbi:MAG TPA: hypothetical protein VH187_01580 [Scandinavium sp.]|jgi:hypothetical protein|uniref:hypothetical protein n=1 Tax=Scandinavium sp. TaxID=2830653 RepID=UPI002E379F33|nr:hypothetical protein [Scandinavium sp.]HEX4499849.1 hypothetical protein [Scandinavium sp.]